MNMNPLNSQAPSGSENDYRFGPRQAWFAFAMTIA